MQRYLGVGVFVFLLPALCIAGEVSQINVTGSAEVFHAPDTFTVQIGVAATNKEVKKAVQEAAEKMTAVHDALLLAGLKEQELITSRYAVAPVYSQRPRDANETWSPSIVAYEVTNSLTVRSKSLDLSGAVLDAAVRAGSNQIGELSFLLADSTAAQNQAIAEAIAEARSYAEAAAGAANVKLGPLLTLTVNPGISPRPFGGTRLMSAAATPISTGQIEVSANVSLSYKID